MCEKPGNTAWNPGIESEIPGSFQDLETIYNPDNTLSDFHEIQFQSQQTGLPPIEFINFKPHRLAMHQVIVRVTADVLIREGAEEEHLGIEFRKVCRKILDQYVSPRLTELEDQYSQLKSDSEDAIRRIIQSTFFSADSQSAAEDHRANNSLLRKLSFWRRKPGRSPGTKESPRETEFRLISEFRDQQKLSNGLLQAEVYRSLYRVLGSLINHRGFLGQDLDFLVSVTSRHAVNRISSKTISKAINEVVDLAIKEENFPLIPNAEKPTLISLKGTSAAGKSSLRPMLKQVIQSIGIEKQGYGIISPDIWRKLLLDYQSLGDACKYAGRFTSMEVSIIDASLDRYIREKSQVNHTIPHLLVDRFRFDSFDSDKVSNVLHNTYVKNVHTMYMFFVITPPEATVERGWLRGLQRGRYKSVEDFLGHSVETYSGIPTLFFKWMKLPTPHFVFEFLDNSVEKGQYPTLIARGTQGIMDIFDPLPLIDIVRYQKINVMASNPEAVYPPSDQLALENNTSFLHQCISRLDVVTFTDRESGKTYLQSLKGKVEVLHPEIYQQKRAGSDYARIFDALFH